MSHLTILAPLLALLALLPAAPARGQTRDQDEIEALMTLRKVHRLNQAKVAAAAPAIDLNQALTWTEAQAVTRTKRLPVLVRVGDLKCGSLCVNLRPEIPTAHVGTLLGDTSARLELVYADAEGSLWQSAQRWRTLPAEMDVRRAAGELKAWVDGHDRPAAPAKAPTHKHQCPACGTVWEHTEASFGSVPDHTCPGCGRLVWAVARGDPPVTPAAKYRR